MLELSLAEITRRLRAGEITSLELVQASVERLKQSNPRINAVTHPLYEEALRLARDPVAGPLSGVPFTVKGGLSFKGQPWVGGSWYRKDVIAESHAPSVQRCLAAGAIPVAITNTPEALTWIETDNVVFGRTNNPHDLSRTAGGSSGGEAAALAAGASMFGIGTDFGGSIRIPAAFCGVAGHKSSPGLVPAEGMWPEPYGELSRFVCIGPLARSAKDLPLLLRILGGITDWPSADAVDVRSLRILYYTGNGESRLSPEVEAAVLKSVSKLKALGCETEEWRPAELASSSWIWFGKVSQAQGPSFLEILGNGKRINLASELLRWPFGLAHHTYPSLVLALIEQALKAGPFGAMKMREQARKGDTLKSRMEEKLGQRAVIVCPVFPTSAPRHHMAKLKPFQWGYSGVYNVLGMPATTVRAGRSEQSGLPLGIQVVAAEGQDHLSLAVSALIEE